VSITTNIVWVNVSIIIIHQNSTYYQPPQISFYYICYSNILLL
jgi:hypothetical protein